MPPDGQWKQICVAHFMGCLSNTERNTSVDRGTVMGSRFDGKRSVQHFQSLLHADEAKPPARFCGYIVKAHARIADREMNLTGRSPQSHFEVANATMFGGIAEGFLQNSEKAKRNVGRQSSRQIVGSEINLHFLLLLEFVTEAFRSCGKTK
jgi:hypothetical protein